MACGIQVLDEIVSGPFGSQAKEHQITLDCNRVLLKLRGVASLTRLHVPTVRWVLIQTFKTTPMSFRCELFLLVVFWMCSRLGFCRVSQPFQSVLAGGSYRQHDGSQGRIKNGRVGLFRWIILWPLLRVVYAVHVLRVYQKCGP